MVYQSNKPQPQDILSISQGDILGNFQEIETFWQINHGTINSPTQGFHTQVDFEGFVGDPGLAAPQSSLYTKDDGSGAANLFFQKNPGILRLLTDLPVIAEPPNPGSAGGTRNRIDLPWNMRIYFGRTLSFSASARVVTYTTPYTTEFFGGTCANDGNGVATSCLVTPTGKAIGTAANVQVNWFSVGRI